MKEILEAIAVAFPDITIKSVEHNKLDSAEHTIIKFKKFEPQVEITVIEDIDALEKQIGDKFKCNHKCATCFEDARKDSDYCSEECEANDVYVPKTERYSCKEPNESVKPKEQVKYCMVSTCPNKASKNRSFCSGTCNAIYVETRPKKEEDKKACSKNKDCIRPNNHVAECKLYNKKCICPEDVILRGNKLTTCKADKHVSKASIMKQCLFDDCTEPVHSDKDYCFTHYDQLYPPDIPTKESTDFSPLLETMYSYIIKLVAIEPLLNQQQIVKLTALKFKHHPYDIEYYDRLVFNVSSNLPMIDPTKPNLNLPAIPQKGKEIKKTLAPTDTAKDNSDKNSNIMCKNISCTNSRRTGNEYCSTQCSRIHNERMTIARDSGICVVEQCSYKRASHNVYCIHHKLPDKHV